MISLLVTLLLTQQAGSWAFSYPAGDKPGALLDLRYLNEKVAGEGGYVHVDPSGKGFLRGDGKPIRFWPVNETGYRLKPEEMAPEARFLAKMGVNMIRIHASVSAKGKGKSITDYDAAEVDRIQRYVATVEKQGIYATISPYWANGGHSGAESSWGLGYADGQDIWGLLFFDDRLKAAYKGWVRHLYLDKNPYTGVPLAQDPAVAIAQIQNEDGLFFWTFQGIKPEEKRILSRKFGAWLTHKYTSLANAQTKWAGAAQTGDDWANGIPAMLDTWVMTQPQTGAMKVRTDDQTAFLMDLQQAFYSEMNDFYKKELGYKGLTNACNWITADPVRLNDAERYTYLPTDVMAVNRYYDGVHKGPNEGWRIDEGDFFTDPSVLLNPRKLPVNLKQVVGHPMLITESGWVAPIGYQSEGPLLDAAYQGLTGVQGLYWFSMDSVNYNQNPYFDFVSFPDGNHPQVKWEEAVPNILGQFPAAALLYREGYVKQGEPVVSEVRSKAQLEARELPVISEDPSYDPNHNGSDARAGSSQAVGADPLAFLVGPVETQYNDDSTKTKIKDLTSYIDHLNKTVKSETGELSLNYGKGLFQLNTPRAQAVCGFLKDSGGSFELGDVTIQSQNDYATVTVVAMDENPIKSSKNLLVQVGTVSRPTGWQQEEATQKTEDGKSTIEGFKVNQTGKMPWQVQNTRVTLTVKNAGLTKATLLDAAGYPVADVPIKQEGGAISLRLPPNTMYVILS